MRAFTLSVVVVSILLLVPTGVSPPSGDGNDGLRRACDVAKSSRPCDHLAIPDTTIAPGETRTYANDTRTVTGTIVVETGGTLRVADSTFRFAADSGGILVAPGGTLRILRSVLEPQGDAAQYVLDLAPASAFTLNDSTVRGGHGVKLRTSDADVSGNLLTQIPLALLLENVVLTIHHNHFLDNTVSVNQTGGVTTLDSNRFEGGEFCVRDWLADPTIIRNVFRGCHTGIWHERSASKFTLNDMEDQMNPPGTGIAIVDTNSPVVEANIIRNYGTGILVKNATGYIRNNTISDNLGDGLRVEGNSQPMDVQGNLITGNGGDGIHLIAAEDVQVFNNTITGNGAYGVRVDGATGLSLSANDASSNGVDGFGIVGAPGVVLASNRATNNAATGIVVGFGSPDALLSGNDALSNGQHGIYVRGSGAVMRSDMAEGNGLSGIAIDGASGVTLENVASLLNFQSGFVLNDAGVNASGLVAHSNGAHGVLAVGVASHVLMDANASANGQDGFSIATAPDASVTLIRAIAIGNGQAGLRGGAGTSANVGWWEDNIGPGVVNTATDHVLRSECSYWGSPNGPTHEDNPEGTGDEVVGEVDYWPYRSTPTPPTCTTTEIAFLD